jgi:hypothetical protein
MSEIREFLASIEAMEQERRRLLDTLRMWADVIDQGLDHEAVESFGWNMGLLPIDGWDHVRCRNYCRGFNYKNVPAWVGGWLFEGGKPAWYNYVVLKDGTRVPLKVPVRAPCRATTGSETP